MSIDRTMRQVLRLAAWTLAPMLAPLTGLASGFFIDVGDILTANYLGNKVARVDPGNGSQQTLGSFTAPMDLALAMTGDLYVGELAGAIKRLRLTDGTVAVINPTSSLTSVRGLTIGPNGDLYVTGRSGSVDLVMRVNPATGAESIVTQAGQLSLPTGIEFLDAGTLAVASFLNSRIVAVTLDGGLQTVLAQGGTWIDRPWGLAAFQNALYTGHYDSKRVNRITVSTGAASPVGTVPGFPYGFAIEADGSLLIGAAASSPGQNDMLVRLSPSGVVLASFDVGPRQQISGVDVSPIQIGTPPVNHPPVLDPIADSTVDEGTSLSFRVTAVDTDLPPQILTFGLDPGAPPGATITPAGDFAWTPTEAQGPGTYDIVVRATDSGIPPLSGTTIVAVAVREVNAPPQLDLIDDQFIGPAETLTLEFFAADPDLPKQTLVFTLDEGAPAGAEISAGGLFTWTPGPSPSGTTNTITVRVTDNGAPPLSHARTFTVVVRGPIEIDVGDILAADFGGNSVLKIDPESGSQQVLGTFDAPTDLALSSNGWLYVSEWGGTIERLDLATGAIVPVNPGSTLSEVWGLAIGPDGALFVTSADTDSVVRVDPATGAETLVSKGGLVSGPYGIAFLDSARLVVSSLYNNQIVSVALADGAQTTLAENDGLDLPWGIAVAGPSVFIANYGSQTVQVLAEGTLGLLCVTDRGAPSGLALAANGDLLLGVSSASAGEILRLDPRGALLDVYSGGTIVDVTGIDISTIRVGPATPSPVLVLTDLGQGSYRLRFVGVPGLTYRIEATDGLAPPPWQTLHTQTADTTGIVEWVDTPSPATPNRFYRAVHP